jgi:endogenous inhibitor of DNA gyrase (YacG/DUF329 family)
MAGSVHILGNLRWVIVAVCTLSGGVAFCLRWPLPGDLDLTSQIIRYGIYFGGAFLIGIILTAESLIRFYLSILIAAVSTAIVVGIAWLLLKAFQVEPITWLWIIGVITALIALISGYQKMNESTWIGVPCPDCSVRGKLSEQDGDRNFCGSEVKKTSEGWKTFDNYVIDVSQTCSNCGSARSWTKHESNQRF